MSDNIVICKKDKCHLVGTRNIIHRDFPTFLNHGSGSASFGKNSSLIYKIGKTRLEKLKVLFTLKSLKASWKQLKEYFEFYF